VYCPQCGTQNADGSRICIKCGQDFGVAVQSAPAGVVLPPGTQPPVQNYLVPAILVTVLCCLPAGIVAIVYAGQVNTKLAAGDIVGAQQASKNAKTWCIISVVALFVMGIAWMMLVFLGVMSQHRWN
jgi:interferon-induced transmembrane protein/zinc ribbon protein